MPIFKIKLRELTPRSKQYTICYWVSHKRRTQFILTEYTLYQTEWNDRRQHVICLNQGREFYLTRIQRWIESDKAILERVFRELEHSKMEYTLQDIVNRFNQYRSCDTFFAYIDKETEQLYSSGHTGTARNYQAARSSFLEFIRDDRLPLTAITEELIVDYEQWLKKNKIQRNTTSFYMRQLRSIFNKAVKAGATEQSFPFRRVYTGIDKTKKRAVDESVIARLINQDLSQHSSLEFTRDIFLLSFYMRGTAFVDIAYLKKENLKNGVIRYMRHKTDISIEVKVEECISKIINRYTSNAESDYLLPIITETDDIKAYKQYKNKLSYYNKLLKRLSSMLELDVLLTSYVSRHTWATIARNINISLPVISAGMGHSSEATTRIYLASLEASTIDKANQEILQHVISAENFLVIRG